jgi:chromosome segregation ATPase
MTPLDAEKRRLQEEAARLKREMEEKQQLIERAPQMKAEYEKRRREELVTRASRTEARFGSPGALPDPRYGYELNIGAAAPRRLRRERHRGMWTFFALLLLLGLVIYWVYNIVLQGLAQ